MKTFLIRWSAEGSTSRRIQGSTEIKALSAKGATAIWKSDNRIKGCPRTFVGVSEVQA